MYFVIPIGLRQACAICLLPSTLSESAVVTLSKKGQRRSFWKPSVAEGMSYFVDIQQVNIL
jgi:hypothetical protein